MKKSLELKIKRYICPRCEYKDNPLMWGRGRCVHCGYYEEPESYGKTKEQVKPFNESRFIEGEDQEALCSKLCETRR